MINELNNVVKDEKQIQEVAEMIRLKIALLPILQESEVFKNMKLGEDALITDMDINGSTIELAVSKGEVTIEEK